MGGKSFTEMWWDFALRLGREGMWLPPKVILDRQQYDRMYWDCINDSRRDYGNPEVGYGSDIELYTPIGKIIFSKEAQK